MAGGKKQNFFLFEGIALSMTVRRCKRYYALNEEMMIIIKTGETEALEARQPPGMPKQDQSAQLHTRKCTCHVKWFMMSNWHMLQVSRFFHFLLIGL